METNSKELDQKHLQYIEWLRSLHPFGIYYHYESGLYVFLIGLETPYSFPGITNAEKTEETDSGFWISNRGGGSFTPEQEKECKYIKTLTEEQALQSIKEIGADIPDDPFEDYILRCKEVFIEVTKQEENNSKD